MEAKSLNTLQPPLLDLSRIAMLQSHFENALEGVLVLMGSPSDRKGIYVAHGNEDGLILTCNAVGRPPIAKAAKYYTCAGNKVTAIGEGGEEVLTSDEVAKPEDLIFGGGHRDTDNKIWAASGLPEPWQDACVTLLALRWAGIIGKPWSTRIAELTQNRMWSQVEATFIA